jgi:small subunit ribosomal protein S3
MRLGINRTWKSRWFAKKNYAELLKEDLTIRKYVSTKLARAGISVVIIERKADKVVVNVRTARPGIVIGRKGIEVERLNKELEHLTSRDIRINILEVKRVELDAQLRSITRVVFRCTRCAPTSTLPRRRPGRRTVQLV